MRMGMRKGEALLLYCLVEDIEKEKEGMFAICNLLPGPEGTVHRQRANFQNKIRTTKVERKKRQRLKQKKRDEENHVRKFV